MITKNIKKFLKKVFTNFKHYARMLIHIDKGEYYDRGRT